MNDNKTITDDNTVKINKISANKTITDDNTVKIDKIIEKDTTTKIQEEDTGWNMFEEWVGNCTITCAKKVSKFTTTCAKIVRKYTTPCISKIKKYSIIYAKKLGKNIITWTKKIGKGIITYGKKIGKYINTCAKKTGECLTGWTKKVSKYTTSYAKKISKSKFSIIMNAKNSEVYGEVRNKFINIASLTHKKGTQGLDTSITTLKANTVTIEKINAFFVLVFKKTVSLIKCVALFTLNATTILGILVARVVYYIAKEIIYASKEIVQILKDYVISWYRSEL